jgi:hypothetical protein
VAGGQAAARGHGAVPGRRAVRGRSAAALVLAGVLWVGAGAPPAAAQAIELSMMSRGGFLTASLAFRWARSQQIIDSLHRGLQSRITFTTRLYETRSPPLSWAGDRLLAEKTVTRSAFWDFLDKVFVVEQEGGPQKTYADSDEMLHGFFSLEETFAYAPPTPVSRQQRYVAARAQFEPVRLMPPLTLVGLAGAAVNVTTPWARREVP